MTNKIKIYCALCLFAMMGAAAANDYALVKNGKAASCIVLPDNAGPVEKHAAGELSLFLGKVTGAKVDIQNAPSKELYNIYLGAAAPRSAAIDKAVAQLKDDGFVLAADQDGLRIISQKPVGVLYGSYDVLKRYAGMRWFLPGAEFEHCPKKQDVVVPGQITVSNPSFKFRYLFFYCANCNSRTIDSWDWFVRNGFKIETSKSMYKVFHEEMEKRGAEIRDGYHCFSTLLNDNLFDQHPEYFPLIDGKRMKQDGQTRQPCTSNPKVAEIMTAGINKYLDTPPQGGCYLIGNNDGTSWCQCDDCVKIDPPEERRKHFVGTRYFTFVNKLAGEIRETHPDAELWAWAYQNFTYPPVGVAPDPRLAIHVCLVGRCYRHSLGDEKCPANAKFREILASWIKTHPANLMTYEYSWCEGTGDVPVYTPKERVFSRDLKYYHKIGLEGFKQTIAPPDGTFAPIWNSRHQTEAWQGEWQLLYLAGQLAWDVDADYDQLVEDMGSKYYGDAWPAMKPYREELVEMYEAGSDHLLGWGGTPHCVLGKCLEQPGVEARLLQLLDEAEALAANDPITMKRVKRDREYFGLWWQAAHKDFLGGKTTQALNANKRVDKIVMDGKFDEDDWRRVDFVTGFTMADGKTAADPQTFVKMLYDADNLYLAVEAMEPKPDAMEREDGLELFLVPFRGGELRHVTLSAEGSPDTGVEVKTRTLADRWTAEIRVPAAKIKDWDVWKMNVVRNRRIGGFWFFSEGESQTSSWSKGAVHGPESFRRVVLGNTLLRSNGLGDAAFLKNGDFEDTMDSGVLEHWSLDPSTGALLEGGAASGRRFLRIKACQKPQAQLFQGITPPDSLESDLLLRAKVRGKGLLSCGGWLAGGRKIDSQAWTTIEGVYKAGDGKKFGPLVFQVINGEIDIDDITVTQQ